MQAWEEWGASDGTWAVGCARLERLFLSLVGPMAWLEPAGAPLGDLDKGGGDRRQSVTSTFQCEPFVFLLCFTTSVIRPSQLSEPFPRKVANGVNRVCKGL